MKNSGWLSRRELMVGAASAASMVALPIDAQAAASLPFVELREAPSSVTVFEGLETARVLTWSGAEWRSGDVVVRVDDALAVTVLDMRGFSAEDFARSHPGGQLGRRLLLHVSDVMRTGDAIPTVAEDAGLSAGLLEMSRQRLRPSLGESAYSISPRCNGLGTISNVESLSLWILRVIEEEAMKESTGRLVIQVPVNVATFLLN